MGLDYTSGCVNFRDVGEWVNIISGSKMLSEGRIYRGGQLDFVQSAHEIGNPKTIINLRRGVDRKEESYAAEWMHFPIADRTETYCTALPVVKKWLNATLSCLSADSARLPVLFHCSSGKDRTGVVIRALLLILGVSHSVIVEEYLLSDGIVDSNLIVGALQGFGDLDKYFKFDLNALRANCLIHRD